ncbi:hypothetical protein [Pseudomonas syringae]|uniref:hypothetical protein n=1 Tax=Pseudomonas syringae TaxID=317 RepID=UPI001F3CFA9A|nr:hypothetical protein [Pseudomonas syringae]MCF5374501.1 hypothetical protein [Pseudomonas syringae]
MFTKQKPSIVANTGHIKGERYTHPAYGQISVVKSSVGSSGGTELFGSSLNHRNVLTITLSTAYMERNLNQDWIHGDRQIVSFQMSESQWATFVSSAGGAGVPITYQTRPVDDAHLQMVPGIESPETMREQYDREIRDSCEAYMATTGKLVEQLEAALVDGKTNKATLKELLALAKNLNIGMPNTMTFVQNQMAKTMDRTVASGKMEIEAFVNNLAQRTGIEALRQESALLIDSKTDIDDPSS